MVCKNCGAQIDDKAVTCAHCGTQISSANKPVYKKWWFWAIIVVVALIVVGGGNSEPADATTPTESYTPQAIKVSAEELRSAYEQNEVAAEKKYDDQLVEITGIVGNIGTDILNNVYITLTTGKYLHSVQCYFKEDAEVDKVATLVSGQEVVIVGTCKGLSLTNVSVKNCRFLSISPLKSNDNEEEVTTGTGNNANDNLTVGQKNALKKAINYLDFSPFSREGLIDQLEYEGYTNEEAVFAADNCNADWYKQALKDASNYLDFKAFSYSGLIKQLEYEKYTSEQATYAADNCKADWYDQAAKCAASYLDYRPFSRQGLIDQLEYEGFTHDQAVYGVEQNGL